MKALLAMALFFGFLNSKIVANDKKEKKNKTVTFFQNAQTTIRDPFEMRDPFKRKREVFRKQRKKIGTLFKDDSFSNLPSIEGVGIEDIRVTGVLLGKNRRAIAKIMSDGYQKGQTVIIKEGMTLGANKAEVKAIMPGGIILVEKITSVYDQDEYLETIIPISSE